MSHGSLIKQFIPMPQSRDRDGRNPNVALGVYGGDQKWHAWTYRELARVRPKSWGERRRGSRWEWRDRSDSGESDLMPDLELLLSPTFGLHPRDPDKSELWVTG